MTENIRDSGCSQRDSAEHEGYAKASRSFNRIWKERDSAQPKLLEAILYKDNFNRAYKRVKANKGALGIDGMTIEEALPYLKEHQQEIKNCVDAGINVFIKKAKANNATKDNEFRKEKFIYNGETDEYTCPAGDRLRFFENTSKNGMKYRKYKCTDCNSCKYKKDCTTSSSGRTIQRWVYEDVLETVYNETLNNNEVYKQRRCIVEHPFGTIKRSLGYSFFLRRRQENVDAEAASMFIAYNFKRLLSMFSTEELVTKFEESVM